MRHQNLTFNFTEALVDKTLKNMKCSKATGHDELPSKLLKDRRSELTTHLTFLFNRVIFEEKIPDSWKIAKILPLHKKEQKIISKITDQSQISQAFLKCLKNV